MGTLAYDVLHTPPPAVLTYVNALYMTRLMRAHAHSVDVAHRVAMSDDELSEYMHAQRRQREEAQLAAQQQQVLRCVDV